jgi:branched-chain amino acid transport system ATP-binding protein
MAERFPVLGRMWDKAGSQLSGGEQQQLAIARALLSRPRLLLLDEPTLGLAPLMVDRVFEILQELKEEGVTILLVEQNAMRTIEVADRTYVLRAGGRIQYHGTAEELAKVGEFDTAFIGLGAGGGG